MCTDHFPADVGITMLDYKIIGADSFLFLAHDSIGSVVYRTKGTSQPEYYPEVPFSYGNVIDWDIWMSGTTFKGALWFTKSGFVYGTGFGVCPVLGLN